MRYPVGYMLAKQVCKIKNKMRSILRLIILMRIKSLNYKSRRHCERSEAIHFFYFKIKGLKVDCFACLMAGLAGDGFADACNHIILRLPFPRALAHQSYMNLNETRLVFYFFKKQL